MTVNWQVSVPENLTACRRRRCPSRRPAGPRQPVGKRDGQLAGFGAGELDRVQAPAPASSPRDRHAAAGARRRAPSRRIRPAENVGRRPQFFSRRARPSTGLLAPPRGWVNGLATIGFRATTTSTDRVGPTRPPRGGQPRRAPGDGCVDRANGARRQTRSIHNHLSGTKPWMMTTATGRRPPRLRRSPRSVARR